MKYKLRHLPPRHKGTKLGFLVSWCLGGLLAAVFPITIQAQGTFKGTPLTETVNTAYDELVPRLSPDDQTLYFVRHQHPGNQSGRAGGQDIWYATRSAEGGWNTAINAGPVLNNVHHNFVGGVVMNGNGLVLGNTYGPSSRELEPGFSFSKRSAGAWGTPVTMVSETTLPEKSNYLDFYCTPDLELMILSKLPEGSLKEDLYVSRRIGDMEWSEPQPLGSIINTTEGFETGPFLSADTKRLFFTSSGHGGEGNADIFMAERLDDTWINWSEPINLGPEVNTVGFDGHLILDSREKMAYFVSGPTPAALGDIYEIPVSEISVLRQLVPDTLRIYALAGAPVDLDLTSYGIDDQNLSFIASRAVDGPGRVRRSNGNDRFIYSPDPKFQGIEHHEFEICDPPQSDNCRKLILRATVSAPNQPVVEYFYLRTPKNEPVDFHGMVDGLSLPETRRNYRAQLNPKGEISVPAGVGATFIYWPKANFVGVDSIPVYGVCPNGETSNCIRAIVRIEVYGEVAVTVVDTPKVTVVDIPKAAVVDTPKVAVADTPKVVFVTPKVVKVDTTAVAKTDTPLVKEITLSGNVRDERTGKPVGIEILGLVDGKQLGKVISDPITGAYSLTLKVGPEYTIVTRHPYYFPFTTVISTPAKTLLKGPIVQDIVLTPLPMEAGQTVVLNHIYFDAGRAILKPESKEELTRLYELLRNNPTMEIEIRGHTDNQGDDNVNLLLSENRAYAVLNYLKYKGVMGYRLNGKGMGEKNPISSNDTPEGRAMNRRVEFTVLRK